MHVYAAVTLWRRAKQARTRKYVVKKHTGVVARPRGLMRWGGLTLLLFIVWHLLNFTIGKVNVPGGETNDPYNLLVDTFDVWWMTLIYLLAMVALGDAPAPRHLERRADPRPHQQRARPPQRARRLGWILAVVIAGGFSLVPIFVLAGVITK